MPHKKLEKIPAIRQMGGKGAPMPLIPGVIGATMQDSYSRSLGGLIVDTKDLGPTPETHSSSKFNTEKGAVMHKAPATHISGQHYGQILYPGAHMGHLGKREGVEE
jgi:hypothetical protein